ncbi:MAG: MMPL family transporter [Frankia sp.]
MTTLARWCFRHRRIVLLLWIAALIGIGAASSGIGATYKNNFNLPSTESHRAQVLLARDFPAVSGDEERIVLAAQTGTVRDADVQGAATAMLAKVARLPHVTRVTSPYGAAGTQQISADGKIAFATVDVDKQSNLLPKSVFSTMVTTAQAADSDQVKVALSGNGIELAQQGTQSTSELIGIIAAAVVLFIAFGSLLAMTLPLISAIVAIGVGISSIGLLTHAFSVPEFGPTLGVLLGLGVGVDYALFIVSRHRSGLREGSTPEEAAVTALNTSGRAVLFAGITVCIALLGMFALGVSFLYGVAISAALVVALTMASALTLLPALLGFYGMRVLSRRERATLAKRGGVPEEPSGFWWRWARFIEGRSRVVAAVGAVIVVVLAIPFFSLRLGSSDAGNDPSAHTTRQAYDLLAEGFGPGFNGPFTVAAELSTPTAAQSLPKLESALRATTGVASVAPPVTSPNGKAAIISVFPDSSPQAVRTTETLHRIRDTVVPRATAGTGLVVQVGGLTAVFEDFSHVLSSKLPLFVGVVVLLAFLLLMAVFRSLVVPLTASIMNLLAVGAAFGVIVTVFQWGWASDVFHLKPGPVEAFIPVLMFAVLFGLSMDYEVFLVSRIHEEWTARRDNRVAVSIGQAETGRVISAAATIMTLVFFSFVLGDDRTIKLFGLGLGSAVLIDAFVIRMLLVPGLMHMLGKANWWLPRWLDRRLPRIAVEGGSNPRTEDRREEPVAVQ